MSDAPGEAKVEPTRPEPPSTEVSAPFWEATRTEQLLVQWCADCDRPIFYPRGACPRCLGDRLEWREARGTGRVYAVTVESRPQDPLFADRAPYAIALVDLDEGVRLLTNIVGCAPMAVKVGMPVTVTWEPLSDGRRLPLFTPAET
jgi:uncharacterized OB-fold protein